MLLPSRKKLLSLKQKGLLHREKEKAVRHHPKREVFGKSRAGAFQGTTESPQVQRGVGDADLYRSTRKSGAHPWVKGALRNKSEGWKNFREKWYTDSMSKRRNVLRGRRKSP